jgi:hypothetical protein
MMKGNLKGRSRETTTDIRWRNQTRPYVSDDVDRKLLAPLQAQDLQVAAVQGPLHIPGVAALAFTLLENVTGGWISDGQREEETEWRRFRRPFRCNWVRTSIISLHPLIDIYNLTSVIQLAVLTELQA